jgi:hypothetical protein
MSSDDIKRAVQEAFKDRELEKKAFRIPSEPHWIQHEFLAGTMEFWADTRKILWRVLLTAGIMGVLSLIGLGITAFIYLKSGGPV